MQGHLGDFEYHVLTKFSAAPLVALLLQLYLFPTKCHKQHDQEQTARITVLHNISLASPKSAERYRKP
ncbi:hypothetical protein GH733_007068 [Mirounga leonina]|nr:hypothetical protein GH733_007068 [Mirounga leonina]